MNIYVKWLLTPFQNIFHGKHVFHYFHKFVDYFSLLFFLTYSSRVFIERKIELLSKQFRLDRIKIKITKRQMKRFEIVIWHPICVRLKIRLELSREQLVIRLKKQLAVDIYNGKGLPHGCFRAMFSKWIKQFVRNMSTEKGDVTFIFIYTLAIISRALVV